MRSEQKVSDAVKSLRLDKGFTQEDLAFCADLSVSHLSKVERGITSPTVKTLYRLAQALGVDVAQFFA